MTFAPFLNATKRAWPSPDVAYVEPRENDNKI